MTLSLLCRRANEMKMESTTVLGADKSNKPGGKKNRNRPRKQDSKQLQQPLSSSSSNTVDNVESGVGKTTSSNKRTTSKTRSNNPATTTPKQQRPPAVSNNKNSSRLKGERGSGGKTQELCTPPPNNTAENSKFAFSAFQASPDASLLPIPSFHRSSDGKDNEDSQQNFLRTPPPAPQDDQQQNRNQQRRNTVSTPNLSPMNDSTVLNKAIADLSLQQRKQINLKEASPVVASIELDETSHDETSSITGINLASLQSSAMREPNKEENHRPSEAVPFDPVAALLNATSTATGGGNLQPMQKPVMGDNWPIQPYNAKYITIPVLIPPNLPLNRVITVHAPPPAISSPIYVQVPHHVVPGMVVPVQVPVVESINSNPILGYSQLPYSDTNLRSRQQQQPATMHHSHSTPSFAASSSGFIAESSFYHRSASFLHHDPMRSNPM